MGKLLVSLGTLPVLAFPVREERTRLGRAPDNEIVLSLPEVADRHAEVVLTADGAVLRALGEEAVLLNGRSVREGLLQPGDEAVLGGYRLRWQADDRDPAADRIDSATHPTSPILSMPDIGAGLDADHVGVVEGPDRGRTAPLQAPAVLIGRAPDCDLVLRDETVSWRHVSVEPTPDGFRVRDLGSRNGTFIDDRKVESVMAAAGHRIRIGRTMLQIVGPSDPVSDEGDRAGLAEMTGRSDAMRSVYASIEEAAAGRVPVLLLGETGTGKELAARALHSIGPRASGPFVPVNCAAIPREMLEDELFGHVRGAFTGAESARRGAFEMADGGTIFLDEIAELPLELQPKLLRILEEGRVPRVGGEPITSDFRLVAATNRDPAAEIGAGRFREDLYYRLAVFPIQLPSLREHTEDLADLVHHFLTSAEEFTGVPGAGKTRFDEDALEPLVEHPWPGNVRELRNVILQAVLRHPGGVVRRSFVEKLLAKHPAGGGAGGSRPQSLEDVEREAIENALRDCGGRRRAAARRLGIAESTLYDKIRRYGL